MAAVSSSSGRLKPVQRARLADLAYDAIRESIVSGGFAMGERLVEMQLASDLAMSRAPIREALRQLSSEGIVVERAHQGTFVAELTAADVVDLYNVRVGLEVTALRLFLKRGESTDQLRAWVAKMEQAAGRRDMSGVVRAEFEFHRHIVDRAGNAVLKELFTGLEGRLMLALALDDASFAQLEDVASEHVPVIDAIEAGDVMHAVRVFQQHLLSTVGEAIERLGGERAMLLEPYAERAPRRAARSTRSTRSARSSRSARPSRSSRSRG